MVRARRRGGRAADWGSLIFISLHLQWLMRIDEAGAGGREIERWNMDFGSINLLIFFTLHHDRGGARQSDRGRD